MQNFSLLPREMVASLWRNRDLIIALVKREVIGRYRGSVSSMGSRRRRKQNGFRHYPFRRHDRAWALRRMHQPRACTDTLQRQLCEEGNFSAGNTAVGRIWLGVIPHDH